MVHPETERQRVVFFEPHARTSRITRDALACQRANQLYQSQRGSCFRILTRGSCEFFCLPRPDYRSLFHAARAIPFAKPPLTQVAMQAFSS